MARTEEQERADRLAARARKKRGTGKRSQERQIFDLSSAVQAGRRRILRQEQESAEDARIEAEHAEFEKKVQKNVKQICDECDLALPKMGAFRIRHDTDGYHKIVSILKNKYYGSDFRWVELESEFVLSKKR